MRWIICLAGSLLAGTGLALVPGCGTPSLLITPVGNTNTLEEVQMEPGRGWFAPKIAMIEVEGMLMNLLRSGWMIERGSLTLRLAP